MLDIKLIRENTDFVKKNLAKKRCDLSLIDKLLKIDEKRRELIGQIDDLKAEKNRASEKIAKMQGAEKNEAIAEMQKVSEKEKALAPELQKIEGEFNEILSLIPNIPLESVPEGKNDTENVVIRIVGQKPQFEFQPRDHIELGKKLDIIDIETAAEMSGTRFNYLKGDAVLLEFALVQHILSKLVSKGFTPVVPPVLVKEHAMWATGFFPADRNEIYHVNPKSEDKPENDDLFLVGTSEVPLTMLWAGKCIEKPLPLRYCGFSTCFRREAGSYGKDTQGILRVHQFDKIEMYSFCHPEKSQDEHEFILQTEEEIMQDLGFCYQVVSICGGDLGAPAAKKYDIEAWIPTQEKFRELTSCSNCTDYQARRAQIKFKNPDSKKDGKKEIAHTLNGTACAIGRTIIAILENYQNQDGSITIPEILRPYLGNRAKIS